jgi:putative transcriptional regulator
MQNRLKDLRQLRQWSQSDLARELGVSRQAINGFESGKFDPSLDMAFKLAHLFDVAIQDIFTHTEGQPMKTLLQRLTSFFDSPRSNEMSTDTSDFESSILAIMYAQKCAGKSEIGAEHLLAGLLADNHSIAAQLLQASGATLPPSVTIADLTKDFASLPATGLFEAFSLLLPASRKRFFEKFLIPRFDTEGEFVLEMAEKIFQLKGKDSAWFGPEHLLWGLIRLSDTGSSTATAAFQHLGINLTILNQQLIETI